MGIINKGIKGIKELVGFDSIDENDEDEFYDDEEILEEKKHVKPRAAKNRHTEESDDFEDNDYSTIFIDPKQFEDCKKIANYIDKGKMITLNLENVGPNVAQRIMDFLAGAMEIKNASFAQIAKNVYTIVPENMKVFYERPKKREKKLIDLEKGERFEK